jgi:aminopeptidase
VRFGANVQPGQIVAISSEPGKEPHTLLDENAASHIALGHGFALAVDDPSERERLNTSEIHIDFMIGSSELAVTGLTAEGREVPLLRAGVWQI